MTADSAQREPTMEEILASIRRIISEDDKPAEAGADVLELKPNEPVAPEPKAAAPIVPPPAPPPAPKAAAPAPVVPPPPPAPAPAPTLQEVFAEPAPPESAVQEDIMIVEQEDEPAPVAAAPAPKPAPAPRPHPAFSEDTLVGEPAATKAAGALGKLMGSMMVQSGVTLDDVVKEMLKPMLRDWLDANLPQLVETEVQKEIERIRRMAR